MTATSREENHPQHFELLQESHHRITNQLSLLIGMVRLENRSLGEGPAVMTRTRAALLLNDIAARLVSISQFHRRMVVQPLSPFDDLPALIVRTCSDLTRSLVLSDRLRFHYVLGQACRITADEAFAIGLLVSEIAMNSVKHAQPQDEAVAIGITCGLTADGRPEIEFSDNGGGLPKEFDEARDGGAGFQIISGLARQMKAEIIVQSDDLGLSFRIVLPARRPDRAQCVRIAPEQRRRSNVEPTVWLSQRGGDVHHREMALHS